MSVPLRISAVLAGVAAYLAVALLASAFIRRRGRDLSQMRARSSPEILLIGGAANLLVLASVLLLTTGLLHQPVRALAVSVARSDVAFAAVATLATFASAWLFLIVVRRGRVAMAMSRGRTLLLILAVLFVIALQEEVLFRGYLVLALRGTGAPFIVVATTAIFVLIHLPTNRASGAQLLSWTLGGLVLIGAYLTSGSLWVPIALHFAVDASNVLMFRITGEDGMLRVEPPVQITELARYRVVYAILIASLLLGWYGASLDALQS